MRRGAKSLLAVMGLSILVGCNGGDPVGPSDNTPYVNPDGMLWSNSGWKGVTVVDLKLDTIYEVVLPPGLTASAITASTGSAFVGFTNGEVAKVDALSRLVTATQVLSSDTGTIISLVADAQNLWCVDSKEGRAPALLKASAATLARVASSPIHTDTCKVGALRICGDEVWLYHTNPSTLARVNVATGAIDARIALGAEMSGMAEFGCEGGYGWVLSRSGRLVKVDLSTQTVTASAELAPLYGDNLVLAVSSSGVFVTPKGVSPFSVYKLSADLASAQATFQSVDSSLTEATLGYLEARGSRLVAVVNRGSYNQYAEIDVATMTLMRGIGETYCYGFVIGD